MLRKIMALVIAAAILMAMCIIPTGAETIGDHMVFNADYRTGDMKDQTGKYAIDENGTDDPIFKEVGGVNAAVFGTEGSGSLMYKDGPTLIDYDLSKGLTVEAYVNLDPANVATGNIFCLGINAILLTDYNDASDKASGFRCTDNNDPEWTVDPSKSMCNAYKQESLTRGEWHHLIGVCDGTTNVFYLDGEKVAENTRVSTAFHPQTMNEDLAKSITIGNGGGAWSALLEGAVAFTRMYTTAVTAEEAKIMYEDAKSGAAPQGPTADPSKPTEQPAPDKPTEAPADKPTAAPATPTQPPKNADNAKTFDIGLVALAAVSLSSLVVVRRKRG